MQLQALLIAPNAFKGSLSADECALAMAEGARDVLPGLRTILRPISDGGEGLVGVLAGALGADNVTTEVSGPLPGQRVEATWAITADRSLAIMEMAAASGLMLVPEARRDPNVTTTYGLGELIREALNRGVSSMIIGIGGSATNDGGAGMAEALGVRFLDESGALLPRGGMHLQQLARVDAAGLDARLNSVKMTVACDVQNPLTGPQGASMIFGPQKGGSPDDVRLLDQALTHYGQIVGELFGRDFLGVPGGGAAGGLGMGLLAFCRAELKRGIDIVLDAIRFDESLAQVDLVVTGEGKIDAQTTFGKGPAGVLRRARIAGKPVAALVGVIEGDPAQFLGPDGFVDIASLVDDRTSREEAIRNARMLVRRRMGEMIERLIR